ncbi:MAG: hypothetical protein IPK07_27985 [Deltaproteobacteria bacterium]|nr:hypothetical protein [Deltaproteobacteria bacterium]
MTRTRWPLTNAARGESRNASTPASSLSAPSSTVTSAVVAPLRPSSLPRLFTKPSSAACPAARAALPSPSKGRPSTTTRPQRASLATHGWPKSNSSRSRAGVSIPLPSKTSAAVSTASGTVPGTKNRGGRECFSPAARKAPATASSPLTTLTEAPAAPRASATVATRVLPLAAANVTERPSRGRSSHAELVRVMR